MPSSRTSKLELTVRVATADDVETLVDLMREFYAEANFPLDRVWAAEAIDHLLAKPELGKVWIATSGERAIGHAVLSVRFTMEHGGLCIV